MKNFYEAITTKSISTVNVKLTLTPVGNVPCLIRDNNQIHYDGIVITNQIIEWNVPLTNTIDIGILIRRAHPDALEIALSIDDIDILPLYQNRAVPPTSYINFNTEWTFTIPSFYPWYHEITGQGWIA